MNTPKISSVKINFVTSHHLWISFLESQTQAVTKFHAGPPYFRIIHYIFIHGCISCIMTTGNTNGIRYLFNDLLGGTACAAFVVITFNVPWARSVTQRKHIKLTETNTNTLQDCRSMLVDDGVDHSHERHCRHDKLIYINPSYERYWEDWFWYSNIYLYNFEGLLGTQINQMSVFVWVYSADF